jgi:hypothetical protein
LAGEAKGKVNETKGNLWVVVGLGDEMI